MKEKGKIYIVIQHILVWGVIFIFPLFFIPLVENAFKHGISAMKSCVIDIQIKAENEKLYFKIQIIQNVQKTKVNRELD